MRHSYSLVMLLSHASFVLCCHAALAAFMLSTCILLCYSGSKLPYKISLLNYLALQISKFTISKLEKNALSFYFRHLVRLAYFMAEKNQRGVSDSGHRA